MDKLIVITVIIFIYLFYVACTLMLKDYGCKNNNNNLFDCKEEEYNHLKGSILEKDETCESAINKMRSSLKLDNKTGVWKTCYLSASIITVCILICNRSTGNINYYFYVLVFLITFLSLYIIKNLENYHKYRPNKENGYKIIEFIRTNCVNKNFNNFNNFNNSTPI